MPSETVVDIPPEAAAVASRYRRLERPISGAVAVLVGLLAATALLWLPLFQAAVVAVVAVAVVRVPVFEGGGRARLVTDADPEAVRADFESATPPPLALQWGIADAVRRTAEGASYHVTYLLGLRSTTMAVETRSIDEPALGLELVVSADGRPWATYTVSIAATGDRTAVDVDFCSDRRFGLRRLPQWFAAERYREAALTAQGYTVEERDVRLSR